MSIKECNIIVREAFPKNWNSKIDLTNIDDYNNFIALVNSTTLRILEHFNKSVISGEYIEEYLIINKNLDDLTNLLNELLSEIDFIEYDDNTETLKLTIEKYIFNNLIENIQNCCKRYSAFISKLDNQIYSDNILLFEARKKNIIDKIDDDNTKAQKKIFTLNIQISQIDHNISINENVLKNLIIIRQEISDLDYLRDPILGILNDKCNYLIKKILYRLKRDENISYLYTIDFVNTTVDLNNLEEIKIFKEFDIITQCHYEIDSNNSKLKQKERYKDALKKIQVSNRLNYIDFHSLIKVFKDHDSNPQQIKNLYEKEFLKIANENLTNISHFDQNSINVIKNYIYNNYFSCKLEDPNLTLSQIEEFLFDLRIIQNETEIKNYFPYYKTVLYLKNRLDILFKNKEINYSEINTLFKKVEEHFETALKHFEWCRRKNYIVFKLPFKECCISSNNQTIFLASTFVLPVNYERTEEELKELKRKIDGFKTLIEVDKVLSIEKEIIYQTKKELDKSDRRSIEILAIFSAIVMFTSSSIQIFSKENISFEKALKFMLCFSYCIILFVFLIWLITRENPSKIHIFHKVFFVLLGGISILSFCFIIKCFPFN